MPPLAPGAPSRALDVLLGLARRSAGTGGSDRHDLGVVGDRHAAAPAAGAGAAAAVGRPPGRAPEATRRPGPGAARIRAARGASRSAAASATGRPEPRGPDAASGTGASPAAGVRDGGVGRAASWNGADGGGVAR